MLQREFVAPPVTQTILPLIETIPHPNKLLDLALLLLGMQQDRLVQLSGKINLTTGCQPPTEVQCPTRQGHLTSAFPAGAKADYSRETLQVPGHHPLTKEPPQPPPGASCFQTKCCQGLQRGNQRVAKWFSAELGFGIES